MTTGLWIALGFQLAAWLTCVGGGWKPALPIAFVYCIVFILAEREKRTK